MTFTILLLLPIAYAVLWNKPKHLLFLTILMLPAYQIRFSILEIPTTALELTILILVARWLVHADTTRIKAMRTEHRTLSALIAMLLIAATIGLFIAPDMRAAAGIYKAYFIEPILVFIAAIDLIRSRADVRNILIALAAVSAAVALATIAQFFSLLPTHPLWLEQQRFTGIFPYPNAGGLFLAPLIPLFLAASRTLCEKREGIVMILVALASLIAIFLTKTEGAIVALIASYILWGLVKNRRTRLLSFLAAATIIALIQTNSFVADKLLFRDWSGQVRTMMWTDTITMLEDNRFLGVGLSGYPTAFAPYHRHPAIEIFQYPHNIVLNFWSETGALGLFAISGIIAYFWYLLFTQPETKHDALYHALGIGMLTLIIHGLVDVPYFKNDLSVVFWLLMALIVASPSLYKPATSR